MAEYVIAGQDTSHPDPEKDRRACQKKGDVLAVGPDGKRWGTKVVPPRFCILKVPGLDHETVRQHERVWSYDFDFTVLQRSVPLDGWRFKVRNLNRRASDGAASPQTEHLQDLFERWAATFVRRDDDGVVLDWTVAAGAASPGFLGVDPASIGIVITETAYDEASGLHSFHLDASGFTGGDQSRSFVVRLQRLRKAIGNRLAELDGAVLNSTATTVDYTMQRDSVVAAFKADVQSASGKVYRCRRFAVPAADVDTMLAAGGTLTVTPAQLAARLMDHVAG